MERLQKLISAAGVCSRRAAEQLILEGRVTVNGAVVRELGTKAAAHDVVAVDGQPIRVPKRWRYVVLHKPTGVVTTRQDPQTRATIYDLLYDDDRALHPVGRLDYDTSGLLLLTNDGELTHRLTHPSYEIERVYQVRLRRRPTKALLRLLRRGVELEDGPAKPRSVTTLDPDTIELTLAEGRNREVRRLIEAVGAEVVTLTRTRYGSLHLGKLKPGKARPLRDDEVRALRRLVGLVDDP